MSAVEFTFDVRLIVTRTVLEADLHQRVYYFEWLFWQRLRDLDRLQDEAQAEELDLRALDTGQRQGDLRAFLRILGPTFDDLKERIDHLPELVDPDRCPAQFLPHLGALVGFEPPEDMPTPMVRKRLKLAVETYRRLGTMPSLDFDLRVAGIEGEGQETYPFALRLGFRARLGATKLPGRVYGLGVYRVLTSSPLPQVREVAMRSHPAGKKLFLTQRFQDFLSDLDPSSGGVLTAAKSVTAFLRMSLRLRRHTLGGPHVLTYCRDTWNAQNFRHNCAAQFHPQPGGHRIVSHSVLADISPTWAGNLMTVVEFP